MASTYLASKPRYEILDGLRGVAAMIVVAFHLFETYSKGPVFQILNHGYLAVDFFFVLSGFVIGYAYDDRWNKMTTWGFFKRRLVRLHPMVIMGTALGALLFYFSDCSGFPLISKTSWQELIMMMLFAFTMLPATTKMDIRGWGETNPLNGPAWSLQWEYIANILYATIIRHFSKTMLAIFLVFAAFLTLNLTMNWDVLNVLQARNYAAYTVIGGWSLTPDQICIGASRLLYPFFAGLLLSRINKLIKVRAGFWWCSLLIAALLVMPRIGGTDKMWMNGIYESTTIIVLFPLIVSMGAGSNVSGRSVTVCKFFGEISYPLYIIHYPLVYLQVAWMRSHPDAPLGVHIFVSISVFAMAIAVAYACLKLYDIPVRNWLKKNWLMK
ncbi:acyltransferase family protein [Prevotella sp.]|uniref:acyltransferase family protein n=1 Tax=Prevotella sp. TaxID=59823 RepID=UPI002647C7AC|nr:acyltransferase [Prevotella sp.]MDN5554631.1 acyltransferase [Prevotella sp.]